MPDYIKAVSYYLPKTKLTNKELSRRFPEWSADKLFQKLGIKERAVAGPDEFSSDLGVKAAEKLFREYNLEPDQIDFVLFCTQSPDYFLPTTACLIQDRLDIPTTAGALDFNLGCSGFVYGLSLAQGLIVAGTAKNVLLITAETYSKFIHEKDRGNLSIFGDGAAATLVSSDGFARISKFSLGTDGKGAGNLIVRNGGMRNQRSLRKKDVDLSPDSPDNYLQMNGTEVFNFTLHAVPELLRKVLDKNEREFTEIDFFILHQANIFILQQLMKKCKIPPEKLLVGLENSGNTVSSTIPIVLKEAMMSQTIKKGDILLLAGFGVGYSFGGTVINF